jgi:hypothetical protein
MGEQPVQQQLAVPGSTYESQVLDLEIGELVEVRSQDEIFATLDENGALDQMPFMPEMLRFVGQRFPVYKLAHKTCDTATRTGGRSVAHTVHLQLRCGGSGHDGCQAGCLIFWKEAWLKRVDESGQPHAASPTAPASRQAAPGFTLLQLQRATSRPDANDPGTRIYACQNTQIPKSTTLLPWWDARQYVRDVTSGNVTAGKAAFVLGRAMFNAVQRKRGGRGLPSFPMPTKTKTPRARLDLQVGELVQVKTPQEIADTLDVNYRNRGLFFDVELIRWCGGTYRVKSRVEKIINEQTGRMLQLPNDCIVLEGVACASECSRNRLLCPREIHHYWREIWLRRVPAPDAVGNRADPPGSVALAHG